MPTIDLLHIELQRESTIHTIFGQNGWNVRRLEQDSVSINEQQDIILIGEREEEMIRVCQNLFAIREQTNAMIWLLSKNSSKDRRMIYLKLGVDGIIEDKVDSEELVMLLNNVIKRFGKKEQKKSKEDFYMNEGKVQLLSKSRSLLWNGDIEVSLTKYEYQLLSLLTKSSDKALSYDELANEIWEGKVFEVNEQKYRLANIVFKLREKFKRYGLNPYIIKTVRSSGYRMIY